MKTNGKRSERDQGAESGGGPAGPAIGILEWFRPGEHERVERVLADLKALRVSDFRTGFSWADWHTPEGQEWYAWLLPRLAKEVRILPCFVYTPPSLGLVPRTCSPPKDPKAYADFLDLMVDRFGRHFEWVELWNEPNNRREWDYTLDPDWTIFSKMIAGAAYWMKQRGKRTVLGGTGPMDPNWVRMMCERGVMEHIDALGVHGFPQTYEFNWEGWEKNVARMRSVLDRSGVKSQIWITETGYSTGRNDERNQLGVFLEALDAPVERVYWYAAQDLDPDLPTVDGFHSDEKEYHFGLRRADGNPKLLHRLWEAGGAEGARRSAWMCRQGGRGEGEEMAGNAAKAAAERAGKPARMARPVLITGGSGFIGTNVAHRLASAGRPVLIYDNLSRPGVEANLRWLREVHGGLVQVEVADVLDVHTLRKAVSNASQVFHFAAQVAVTTSLVNPTHDFLANARGTLNLLEAIRAQKEPPSLLFTSTNKVYGGLPDLEMVRKDGRYEPKDRLVAARGIGEDRGLDFHSPYGCSKGAADQYVIDYARTYAIPAVVFRMSCIYGPHQFGTEDQGWVAHFLLNAIAGKPITLYGDGRQVRDILYVEDLVDAMLAAQERIESLSGRAFNMGGGPGQTISLLELLDLIRSLNGSGSAPAVSYQPWRPGDQRYYVSDTSRFQAATEWMPQVGVEEGVERLYHWLRQQTGAPLVSAPLALGSVSLRGNRREA